MYRTRPSKNGEALALGLCCCQCQHGQSFRCDELVLQEVSLRVSSADFAGFRRRGHFTVAGLILMRLAEMFWLDVAAGSTLSDACLTSA